MLQKKTMRITAKYRIPEVKKYKNGWRIVFWYQKNGELKRHILRCEKYKKSFERAKDAEVWINENLCVPLTQELQNGWTPEQGMPNFCDKSNNDIHLSELADLFLEDAYERYKAKLINYTSYSGYKSFCKVISSSTSFGIEDCNIQEITRVKAEKFIVQIKALREWQAKTTNNFIKLCRMLFKFAVDNSLASVNPFEKVALIKGEQKSKRTLSKEEQTKIYDYLHATNVPFLVYTQLVYTDLIRPVEIFRIQCKDLDPNHTSSWQNEEQKGKSSSYSSIPRSSFRPILTGNRLCQCKQRSLPVFGGLPPESKQRPTALCIRFHSVEKDVPRTEPARRLQIIRLTTYRNMRFAYGVADEYRTNACRP